MLSIATQSLGENQHVTDSLEAVLVSSCLLGQKVRYHGTAVSHCRDKGEILLEGRRMVTLCPEIEGGKDMEHW